MAFITFSPSISVHHRDSSFSKSKCALTPTTKPIIPKRPSSSSAAASFRACASISTTTSSPVASGEEEGDWESVTELVISKCPALVDDKDKAEGLVKRAFGWGTQKFWRGRMKQQPPSNTIVTSSIEFLQSTVGLNDTQISTLIPKFPEVLALSVARMQENVKLISNTYPSLKDKLLINAIMDNPAVLGYDFDCEGDCKSECARCWVQF